MKQTHAAGFNHHLVKPVDYEKLQAVLASRCGGSASSGPLRNGHLAQCAGNTPM
jgi:hypothetical protein